MAIDKPIDAFEQQYMREEQTLPKELATIAGKLALPDKGLALEILQKVAGVLFDEVSIKERVKAMWDLTRMLATAINWTHTCLRR